MQIGSMDAIIQELLTRDQHPGSMTDSSFTHRNESVLWVEQ